MELPEKLRLLGGLKVLEGLSEDQLGLLSGFLKTHLLEDSKTVFEEGSPGESLFFLASGEVSPHLKTYA